MEFRKKRVLSGIFAVLWAGVMALCVCACSKGDSQNINYEDFYKKKKELSSQELLRLGQENQVLHPDSALFYFSMAVARHTSGTDRKEQRVYAEALTGIGNIHFINGSDYQQAFTYYLKVVDVCESFNFRDLLAQNYYNIGCVYSAFEDTEFSLEYLKKAFYLALEENYWKVVELAFTNMASDALETGTLSKVAREIAIFNETDIPEDTEFKEAIKFFSRAVAEVQKKNYAASRHWFRQMENQLQSSAPYYTRLTAFTLINKQETYILEGNTDSAIAVSLQVEALLENAEGVDDLAVKNLRNLARYYKTEGKAALSAEYLSKAVSMQDRQLNTKKLSQVHQIKSVYETDRLTELIQKEENKRRTQGVILYIVLTTLLVLSVFVVWIIRQNKLLKEKNIDLYRKTQEILVQSERQRRRREEEVEHPKNAPEEVVSEKYQGNNLTQERKEILLNNILSVMDKSPEIYSPNFSIHRLAELTGSGQKYISQVINELYGSNFNHLLSEYRIREACRRIKDTEHFGNLTFEAIAKDLGYKSSSNFNAIFKKIVGLTPTQYRKIGREFPLISEKSAF